MTDNEYISALKLLIDSAISVGRDWLWNDSDIMDTLTDEKGFGLTYDDFVMAVSRRWQMNIFIDTEAMRFVTEKELRQEFEQLKREQPEEYNYTFEQYIQNCTSKNGTLEEV